MPSETRRQIIVDNFKIGQVPLEEKKVYELVMGSSSRKSFNRASGENDYDALAKAILGIDFFG